MWLWDWLCRKKKAVSKKLEPESLRFVRSLVEKHPEVKPHARWSLGYMYEFTLNYPGGIKVEVEYNIVRHEWDIEIWSSAAGQFLYYYDCLDIKPRSTIRYVVEHYGLREKLNAAIAQKKDLERKEKAEVAKIKNKYLGGSES